MPASARVFASIPRKWRFRWSVPEASVARPPFDRFRAGDYVRRDHTPFPPQRTMNPNLRWRHAGSTILSAVALAAASAPASAQKALPPLKVIDPAYMNRNAKACVDFFDFANGGWFARDTIP